jgi:hypothetical protein
MIGPGEYAWQGNNRGGSNHRVLTLIGPEGAIQEFSFMVIHSAGFMGKDLSITTGSVRAAGPDRLELVAKEVEHCTYDDDATERKYPCDRRMVFVAETSPVAFSLVGEPYVPVPPRR